MLDQNSFDRLFNPLQVLQHDFQVRQRQKQEPVSFRTYILVARESDIALNKEQTAILWCKIVSIRYDIVDLGSA